MAHQALGNLPLSLCSLHPSHTSLFLTHVRRQACSHLTGPLHLLFPLPRALDFFSLVLLTGVAQCLAHSKGSVNIGDGAESLLLSVWAQVGMWEPLVLL